MNKFLILLGLIIIGSEVYSFDIVYPKKCNVTINAKSTFFVGSSDTPLTINGQEVPRHSSGGFAYVVNLKDGSNTFKIVSGDECKLFTITKPIIKTYTYTSPILKLYDATKSAYVTTENAPLRSTPIDAGINRMSHLQRNILLNIDGEKNGFYRVNLGDDKFGWIGKTNVKFCEDYENAPAKIISEESNFSGESYKFVIKLNKTVPYEIVEGDPMVLKLYNIEGNDTYTKEFSLSGKKPYGYKGKYEGTDFVWEIRKSPIINSKHPLKNVIIAVDPGHGGYEAGAIGCLGDKEKDVVLNIAKYLCEELEKRGADVIMTRTDDSYIGLKERVDIANFADASIFVSIHGNALPDGADPNKNSGTSIYYYYDQAKPLADSLINTMTAELGLNNDKVRQASFAVVRNTNALSVLIETAYLINPEDNSKLISDKFQKECAKSIANGIENYLKSIK